MVKNKIVVAQGEREYVVVVGNVNNFTERIFTKDIRYLRGGLTMLLDESGRKGRSITPESIQNGPTPDEPWYHIGEPLSKRRFDNLIGYLTEREEEFYKGDY